jgi:NTE family protein
MSGAIARHAPIRLHEFSAVIAQQPEPRLLPPGIETLEIFEDLAPAARDTLCEELEWLSLPGGWSLFNEGESGDSLYVVISGRLGVYAKAAGAPEQLIAQIVAGETAGEMALLSGEPRSATVVAMRDTELLRLPRQAFERLLDTSLHAARFMTSLLVRRLKATSHRRAVAEAPATLAMVPLSPDVPATEISRQLAAALADLGRKVCVLDQSAAPHDTEWFASVERANDNLIFQAGCDGSEWTRLCLRQADRILILSRADQGDSATPPALAAMLREHRHARAELVTVHPESARRARLAPGLIGTMGISFNTHLRTGHPQDVARLARLLTGRAVGIVFSGGGARGFAHVGVLRALREAAIPVDLFGGASMGSIIAAGAAMEWDDDEFRRRLIAAFVDSNPFSDYTLPVVSLARGRKVSRLLREHFGDTRIEESWRTYFCTSSDLTSGQVSVHRSGPLWRAIRASSAIPGVLAPVVEGGHILVDGGVLNNMPIDLMLAMKRGPVIAVDAARNQSVTGEAEGLEDRPLWELIRARRRGTPNIIGLLMRVGTVGSEAQTRQLRPQVDLLIEPALQGISMLDWKAYDAAVEAGYRHTIEILERGDFPHLRA